ncbi:MAG: 1,2-phenylacetyl-CoA epoxidase subunit PaaE [Haliscomenobacter sp.]|uniref:1,2-phenylacetyl-CoA epoxidase subunit PaaE n=1 Tax=Haliscomenobacter sp. TaxID=2717303 RepID=UPI0029B4E313|nr:1,2-phenylacetyl-CoA epoxidase subunit PaaE [Haliscomenobacter sp.]MDX2068304.1 1,2-phenylacetyl-CoA epoxidase subunit PaaE [Haliscomenobacter sp.]
MKFHPLKVADIRPEAKDCVSVALQMPAELQQQFRFSAGQYLTFRVNLQGQEIRRSYSICSSPLEQEWRVAIKKVPGGVFSTFANEHLKVGDTIEVMPPMGRFGQQIESQGAQTYLAFAAGSGITPILAIVKTVLATQPYSRFILLYGNQNRHSILFKAELEALKNRHMGRLSIYHILSREMVDASLFHGRIDAEKCRSFLQKLIPVERIDQCFICGPEDMIHTVKQILIEAAFDPQKIHFELFGLKNKAPKPALDNEIKGPLSKVKIHLDGSTFEIPVAYDGESVLDVALRSGADLPFACKGGVCCTCRAKVLSGNVKMQVNYALEADELAAGYVLTCQSHPRSAQVTLDFDAK